MRPVLDRAVDPGAGGALMLFRLPDGTVHRSAVSRPPGVPALPTEALDLADPLPAAPDANGASAAAIPSGASTTTDAAAGARAHHRGRARVRPARALHRDRRGGRPYHAAATDDL